MDSELYTVFFYGSLKRGEPNHNWFLKSSMGQYQRFLFDAGTVQKYPLVIASKFNIPCLLYQPGVGNNVIGEVYEVDNTVLTNIDQFEDHPRLQVREMVTVRSLSDKSTMDVWVYFVKNFDPDLLEKRHFINYTSKGDHGLPYVNPKNEKEVMDIVFQEITTNAPPSETIAGTTWKPIEPTAPQEYFTEDDATQVDQPGILDASNQTPIVTTESIAVRTKTKCTCKNLKRTTVTE